MLNFDIEKKFEKPVIGVDEVGRGPLAGPVVSCACIFFDYNLSKSDLEVFNDSKKLSKNRRMEALKVIFNLKKNKILNFSLGFSNVFEIDRLNIYEATKLSMLRAIKKLKINNSDIIIDGRMNLKFNENYCHDILKGDEKSITIAAASIIAKIHRDRYMSKIGIDYSVYDWKQNSGYGTRKHIEKIKKLGICIHHRKSFEPIKTLIHNL